MELVIKGKTPEVTDSVRAYAERKFANLDHNILNSPAEAVVEMFKQTTKAAQHRYVVQVTINSKGILLRGEERAADFLTAIDNVSAVMKRQIERYKGKRSGKGNVVGTATVREPAAGEEPADEDSTSESGDAISDVAGKVVKFKRFVLRPMSLDEATEQMELLGHNFFAFLDAGTGKIAVLYRRNEGNYGHIQLEVM